MLFVIAFVLDNVEADYTMLLTADRVLTIPLFRSSCSSGRFVNSLVEP